MNPIQRVSHVGLCVSELETARRFYVDALGFREESRLHVAGEPSDSLLGLDGTDLRAIYLERDGFRLELLYFASPATLEGPRPRAMNQLGFTHLSLRVADLDEAVARALAAGGRLLEETKIGIPARGAAAAFVLDPDGTRVELVQAPGDPAQPPTAGKPS
ncbi:MAG: VOC family protein [Deltaproteobacteria bacterium]|nr:VOC family protein [Deltaproteobacteria bacterium]